MTSKNKIMTIVLILTLTMLLSGCGVKEDSIIATRLNSSNIHTVAAETIDESLIISTSPTPTNVPITNDELENDIDVLGILNDDVVYDTNIDTKTKDYTGIGDAIDSFTESFSSALVSRMFTSTEIPQDQIVEYTPDENGVVPPEAYGINSANPWWAIIDDRADQYRYDQLGKLYNITPEEAKTLTEAYGYYSNNWYNLTYYDPYCEKDEMDNWLITFADKFDKTYNEMVHFVINGFKNGTLKTSDFYGDDDEYYYIEDDLTGYAAILPDEPDEYNYDESLDEDIYYGGYGYDYDEEENEWYWSNYNEMEVEYLPITSDGDLLEVGDKVIYSPDGRSRYHGTVIDIDEYLVRVKWDGDKPSDQTWYDALFMTKKY